MSSLQRSPLCRRLNGCLALRVYFPRLHQNFAALLSGPVPQTWTLHETRNEVLTGLINDGCFLGFKVNHLSSVYLAKLRQKNGQVRIVRIEIGRLVRSESPCRLSAGLSWVARRRAADWKTYRSTHQKRWELPDGCPALGKKRHFHEGESCQHNQVWANSRVVERGEQSRESFTVHVTFFRLFI